MALSRRIMGWKSGKTMRTACLILHILFILLVPTVRGQVPSVGGETADSVRERLPGILEAWRLRVERNGGVHEWNRRNDGMRVFQEWIALLTLARDLPLEKRRQTGQDLERYVVDGDIGPLGFLGTSLPVPGYDDGDFDMALLGCMSLLGLFQDDPVLLTDRTLLHLVTRVVRLWGQSSKRYFDVFFVSVPETENHLFMIESTRFLTNQLIWENVRGLEPLAALRDTLTRAGVVLDNRRGDLRSHLLKVMHQAMCKGFFEFNAQIYQRFTVHALDNLHSFSAAIGASPTPRPACSTTCRRPSRSRAIGSLRVRAVPPILRGLPGQHPGQPGRGLQLLRHPERRPSPGTPIPGTACGRAIPPMPPWPCTRRCSSTACRRRSCIIIRERPAEYRAEIRSAYARRTRGHRDLLRLPQPPAHRGRAV